MPWDSITRAIFSESTGSPNCHQVACKTQRLIACSICSATLVAISLGFPTMVTSLCWASPFDYIYSQQKIKVYDAASHGEVCASSNRLSNAALDVASGLAHLCYYQTASGLLQACLRLQDCSQFGFNKIFGKMTTGSDCGRDQHGLS